MGALVVVVVVVVVGTAVVAGTRVGASVEGGTVVEGATVVVTGPQVKNNSWVDTFCISTRYPVIMSP